MPPGIKNRRAGRINLAAITISAASAQGVGKVLGAPADLIALRTAIESAGMTVESAEVVWIPLQAVSVSAETAAVVERIVDALEDHDDVQHVYTNMT